MTPTPAQHWQLVIPPEIAHHPYIATAALIVSITTAQAIARIIIRTSHTTPIKTRTRATQTITGQRNLQALTTMTQKRK